MDTAAGSAAVELAMASGARAHLGHSLVCSDWTGQRCTPLLWHRAPPSYNLTDACNASHHHAVHNGLLSPVHSSCTPARHTGDHHRVLCTCEYLAPHFCRNQELRIAVSSTESVYVAALGTQDKPASPLARLRLKLPPAPLPLKLPLALPQWKLPLAPLRRKPSLALLRMTILLAQV